MSSTCAIPDNSINPIQNNATVYINNLQPYTQHITSYTYHVNHSVKLYTTLNKQYKTEYKVNYNILNHINPYT